MAPPGESRAGSAGCAHEAVRVVRGGAGGGHSGGCWVGWEGQLCKVVKEGRGGLLWGHWVGWEVRQ
jgi:hypothetical protein